MTPTDPVEYPKVQIGDAEYPLRYRHQDIVRLKKSGINIAARIEGEELVERLPEIIHAGFAHLGASAPALKAVQDHIGDLDYGEIAVYTLAFIEAQKKASAKGAEATAKLKALAREARREQTDSQTIN